MTRRAAILRRAAPIRAWIARRPWIGLALLLTPALLALFMAWYVTRPGMRYGAQDGTWRRVHINRDLYVGLDPSYPPLAEWTPGGIAGLEADLARAIGRRLGVETHILIMGYDSLYDSLYTGTVDLIIAALRPDETQTHWVYYTRSYYDGGQILVAPAARPVESMRELDGGTVAVELASAADLTARRWQRRLHALTIRATMLPEEALRAVAQGDVDAALVDTISARLYLPQAPGLRAAAHTVAPDPYVIALRRENFRLTREVEDALAAIKGDGTLDGLIEQWLGGMQ